jgi:recombination protein RecT
MSKEIQNYKELPPPQKITYLKKMMSKQSSNIEAMLPQRGQIERFIRGLYLTLNTSSYQLLQCTPYSIFTACLNLAYFGLDPSPYLGHGYLVPYKDRATLIIGYKGYVYLMLKSGLFSSVNAELVHDKEEFKIELGLNRSLSHSPLSPSKRGEVIGSYSTLNYKKNGSDFTFMWTEEIEKIRDGSKAYQNAIRRKKDHPWISNPGEMFKKTTIRRMIKLAQFPIGDDRFQVAAAVDSGAEVGKNLLKQELKLEAIEDGDGNFIEPDPDLPDNPNGVVIEAEVNDVPPTTSRPGTKKKGEAPKKQKTGIDPKDQKIKDIIAEGDKRGVTMVDMTEKVGKKFNDWNDKDFADINGCLEMMVAGHPKSNFFVGEGAVKKNNNVPTKGKDGKDAF